MIKKLLIMIICCFCVSTLFLVVGCNNKNDKKSVKIITVKREVYHDTLHYAGVIEPVSSLLLASPIDGFIEQQIFHYGSLVTKDQDLFLIRAGAKRSDFEELVTQFVRAKQDVTSSETKAKTTNELYKLGIVSRDDYNDSQNRYFIDDLAFLHAKKKLDEALELYNITLPTEIDIKNIDSIKHLVESGEQAQLVKIVAPISGVALFPEKTDSSGSVKLHVGSVVKQGDLLLRIADKTGIAIKIKVDEANINHLFLGQKATVVSDLFPNWIMNGYIENLELQASVESGMANFSAKIEIPDLTEEQQKKLHVGMNVSATIIIPHEEKILIPIRAVFQQGNKSFVKLFDKVTRKIKQVEVNIGGTTATDSVSIDAGLKEGDQIVLPD